jgi:hypothetical protein
MTMTETLQWHPVLEQMPDADSTVLIFDAAASEPVWLGYLDGEIWRNVDGTVASPTRWADMPRGPQ